MENLKITNDDKPSVEEAVDLYCQVNLGKKEHYDFDRFEKAFKNSRFITARVNGNLVGLVRYMTDEAHETSVREFIVAPPVQRHGIGSKMLDNLTDMYGHTDLYVNTLSDAKEFFVKKGLHAQSSLELVSRRGQ